MGGTGLLINAKKICVFCHEIFDRRAKEKPCVYIKRKYCSVPCKMKALCVGNRGKLHSEEYKMKMSDRIKTVRLEKPMTEEHKQKIRDYNIGKSIPDEIKQKISKTLTGKIVKTNHWNWQGGITEIRNRDNDTPQYKAWRRAVFKRDGFHCVKCASGESGTLRAHHIKEWSKYAELRYSVDNGLTLCEECHKELHYGTTIKQTISN